MRKYATMWYKQNNSSRIVKPLHIGILGFFLMFMSIGGAYAQNCLQYHVENCRWADRTYLYSRQSRSAGFKPGMSSEFKIVVYAGEEYYISISGHRKLGDIQMRLKEDDELKTILYDNADFKFETYFYFKNSTSRNLIIEISTPLPDDPDENEKVYCLGVLIEFRKNIENLDEDGNSIGF